ncbi:MAG TPA: methylmalonyl-CoA mutase family protein, partial [Thermoanaerobaculia bacterium]|nr:methylmalonyl-CoA mutase family protein [Thermoanaerobaculia bacterium]
YRYQMAVEEKREVVVGMNAFHQETEAPTDILKIDPAGEREQTERLRALRDRRNPERAAAAVRELTAAAREDRNLLPPILDCVRAEVTLGEISDSLREVYGEYREAGLE